MKVNIISDIHGNIDGLTKVLDSFNNSSLILCAGDIIGYYPFVNEVINKFRKEKIISIKGNHEKYVLNELPFKNLGSTIKESIQFCRKQINKENFTYLKNLPDSLEMIVDKKRVGIFHANPWDLFEQRVYPDFTENHKFQHLPYDIIILGHTHYPFIKHIGSLTIVNPGSCGQPRDYNLLSYIEWDTHQNTFKNIRLSWDIKKFIKKSFKYKLSPDLFEVFKRKINH